MPQDFVCFQGMVAFAVFFDSAEDLGQGRCGHTGGFKEISIGLPTLSVLAEFSEIIQKPKTNTIRGTMLLRILSWLGMASVLRC
jgi:hypothetical protein